MIHRIFSTLIIVSFMCILGIQNLAIASSSLSGGTLVAENNSTASQREKLEALERTAETGDAAAQYELGVLYSNGEGVKRDYTKAKEYFELAAAQNYANAQFALGYFYAHAKGVEEDNDKARKYFKLAAAQGHKPAQKALN